MLQYVGYILSIVTTEQFLYSDFHYALERSKRRSVEASLETGAIWKMYWFDRFCLKG